MACIYKRGKTWSYSIDIGRDENGKRKKKGKGGFRTQREAKEAAAIVEAEVANGTFVDEKKITFGELAEQWFAEHSKEIKISTQHDYQKALCRFPKSFSLLPVHAITRLTYQKLLNGLFEQQVSYTILRRIHLCANMIFKNACRLGILKSNPAQYAKIPKIARTLDNAKEEIPKYLEKSELQLFLRTIKENEPYPYYVMFTLLAYTGMRKGEMTALMWDCIDFENKTISITRNIYNHGMKATYVLGTPKTKSSRRIIPVTDNVMQMLVKLRYQQKIERMKHRMDWHDGNFVFTSPKYPGHPYSYNGFNQIMYRSLKRANLPLLPLHSLRHTHTSLLAEAGVPLEAIMERLGHANDNITRMIYLHITKQIKKDAAQKFYELMNDVSR